MKRLIENTVFLGFVIAWRRATWPTSRSPSFVNATTDGVVRPPSAFGMTTGSPPSITATTELVVPRSMPITFAMGSPVSVIVSSVQARVAPQRNAPSRYLLAGRELVCRGCNPHATQRPVFHAVSTASGPVGRQNDAPPDTPRHPLRP